MSERGRPTIYTQEIGAAICAEIAKGRSLRAVCRDDGMPDESTVRNWALNDRDGFFPQYARARIIQAHAMFDETLEIADDGSNDTYETEDGERTNHDVIARSKLRVDTRKWYLSKAMPKMYGDRLAMEHSGPDGGPIETREVTDQELMERATELRNRIATLVPNGNGSGPSTNGKH